MIGSFPTLLSNAIELPECRKILSQFRVQLDVSSDTYAIIRSTVIVVLLPIPLVDQ